MTSHILLVLGTKQNIGGPHLGGFSGTNQKNLIFCVEFRELAHLTCDLSQAEKKITVVSSWQNDNYFYSKWKQFWGKNMSFCAFAQLVTIFIFFSEWDKSRVKWDNYQNSTQKIGSIVQMAKMPGVKHGKSKSWNISDNSNMQWLCFWYYINFWRNILFLLLQIYSALPYTVDIRLPLFQGSNTSLKYFATNSTVKSSIHL